MYIILHAFNPFPINKLTPQGFHQDFLKACRFVTMGLGAGGVSPPGKFLRNIAQKALIWGYMLVSKASKYKLQTGCFNGCKLLKKNTC